MTPLHVMKHLTMPVFPAFMSFFAPLWSPNTCLRDSLVVRVYRSNYRGSVLGNGQKIYLNRSTQKYYEIRVALHQYLRGPFRQL